MIKQGIVAFLMGVLLAGALTLNCGSAGCNCDDTCANHRLCTDVGYGNCEQVLDNRCDGMGCGAWSPLRPDCYYKCNWTNLWCLFGGDCEKVTYYETGCL